MKVFEAVETFELEDERVWVCGDWHGSVPHVQRLLPQLRRSDPGVRTLLHLGDWWMNPRAVDYWARVAGVERVLVTLGNHEAWLDYTSALNEHPGHAVRVSDVCWLLPRPFRFTIGGKAFLSLGGAASIDRLWRTPGKDWWAEETITAQHVQDAIAGGPSDVMLTHETPDSTPVTEVRNLLEAPPGGVPWAAVAESARSRQRVDAVWAAVAPTLLLHGHMHVWGTDQTPDGRRVVSLDRDGPGVNAVLLHVQDLVVDPIGGDSHPPSSLAG